MEKFRMVFAGLRHGHIFSLYNRAIENPAIEIVGIAEEDAATRETLAKEGKVTVTYDSIDRMLAEVDCDIVAIGDCYARRGAIAIKALKLGKHVVADKPLCTTLAELDEIKALAEAKKLAVGCMFDLRTNPAIVEAKKLIDSGKLGKIVQIQFSAQHPLLRATRPSWYFDGVSHGGTINDIGSHASDLIPYLVQSPITKIHAARTWRAVSAEADKMNDAGQIMFELANGCGVMGDVSYAATDKQGYSLPTYWRFNVWGTNGMAEFNCLQRSVRCYYLDEAGPVEITAQESYPEMPTYLDAFISEINGKPCALNTQGILLAARNILEMQKMADDQL